MSTHEPVVVLYKSNQCGHCTRLSTIWDNPPGKGEDSCVSAMRKVYPKIRFYTLTVKENNGKFDENTAPKDLFRYRFWFPMILLVPGKTWDAAMAQLGPKNNVRIQDGVQIMNGAWSIDKTSKQEVILNVQKYDIRKPVKFAEWLKESLENEEFKRIQNSSIVPPPAVLAEPIQNHHHVPATNASSILSSANPPSKSGSDKATGDVCSMRIISRPR
jgi:hypothetical protein